METLDSKYWEGFYIRNETAWDIGFVSPPLKAYFDQLENKDLKILIPGCGNSHEAVYLMESGFTNLTVIDIADQPVKRLREKLSDYGSKVEIMHGDFFRYSFAKKFDLVIEQTFFCAIDPSLRQAYVKRQYELLEDNGILAGVLFKSHFEKPGPPFGGTREEYISLFSDYFTGTFEDCYNSHPRRLGNEIFIHLRKKP